MTRKEIFVIIFLCIQYTCIQMGSLQIRAIRLDDLFIHVSISESARIENSRCFLS